MSIVTKLKYFQGMNALLCVICLIILCSIIGAGNASALDEIVYCPLAVVATSPVDGATGVSVGSSITATFSHNVNEYSLSYSTFYLSGVMTGTVSYNSNNYTATLTLPAGSLAYSTTYTATITTGVSCSRCDDSYPCNMSSNYSWSFTTENPPSQTPNYVLEVSKRGTGRGTITGEGIMCGTSCYNIYPGGTWVTLSATPAEDSIFSGWSGGGCSGTGDCVVQMYVNTLVTAEFSLKTYTIVAEVEEGYGSITPSGTVTVTHGESKTFTITPDAGFWIEDVKVDGESVGSVNTYEFVNVTSDHTIAVIFSTETVSTPDVPSGPANCVVGTSYTFTTGGAVSSLEHPLEYRIDWGDGMYSEWSSYESVDKTWTSSGTYGIKAQTQCAPDMVVSDWSAEMVVTVRERCSKWDDVMTQYLNHTSGLTSWSEVVQCYKEYAIPVE